MQIDWHHTLFIDIALVLPLDRAHPQHMAPYLSLCEWNLFGLGVGVDARAVVEAWHLHNVGVELLYTLYELTYIDKLGLLKYIGDIVIFLLSRVDGEHGKKVKQHAIIKQLT
jgi:hypothetical protein